MGLSLFAVATGLIVGAFVQAVRTQRMVTSLMSVNSNASILIEQMARELRVGWGFEPTDSPSSNCSGLDQYDTLKFSRVRGESPIVVTYQRNVAGGIDRGEGDPPSSLATLTSPDVSVAKLCFVVQQWLNPTPGGDNGPWRITMFLTVGSSDPRLAGRMLALQTSVSSRVLPSEAP